MRAASWQRRSLSPPAAASRFHSRSTHGFSSFVASPSSPSSPSLIQNSAEKARRFGEGATAAARLSITARTDTTAAWADSAADDFAADAPGSPSYNELDSPTGLASFEKRMKRKAFLLERSRSRVESLPHSLSRSMSVTTLRPQGFGADELPLFSRVDALDMLQEQVGFFTRMACKSFFHRTILLQNFCRLKQMRRQRSKARVWTKLQADLETNKARELPLDKKIKAMKQ